MFHPGETSTPYQGTHVRGLSTKFPLVVDTKTTWKLSAVNAYKKTILGNRLSTKRGRTSTKRCCHTSQRFRAEAIHNNSPGNTVDKATPPMTKSVVTDRKINATQRCCVSAGTTSRLRDPRFLLNQPINERFTPPAGRRRFSPTNRSPPVMLLPCTSHVHHVHFF